MLLLQWFAYCSNAYSGYKVINKTCSHFTNQRMFSHGSTGIDSEGHAANFVETEQIVLYDGAMASFVQASLMPFGLRDTNDIYKAL